MTSTSIFLYPEANSGGTAVEWKDVDKNPFFYAGTGQPTVPTTTTALTTPSPTVSIKNETNFILVWVKNNGVGPILGSAANVDFKDVSFLCVLPNTTCSNTAWNWVIGLGVFIGVLFIIIVALLMSGVVVWHGGEGGAGFGYNNNR